MPAHSVDSPDLFGCKAQRARGIAGRLEAAGALGKVIACLKVTRWLVASPCLLPAALGFEQSVTDGRHHGVAREASATLGLKCSPVKYIQGQNTGRRCQGSTWR